VANKLNQIRKKLEAKATPQHNSRIEAPYVAAQVRYVPLDEDERISPPAITNDLTWYAMVVKPGTHRRVLAAMKRARITTYCPVETRWAFRARSNVKEEAQRPLFGSILFIGTDERTNWVAIRFNDDISGVLSNYGKPLAIPADDLRKLADRERFGGFKGGKEDLPKPAVEPEPVVVTATGIKLGDVAQFGEGTFLPGAEVDVVKILNDEAGVVLRHFKSAGIMRVPVSMLRPMPQPEATA
jgi:transcription antitermination factor NusG